MIGDAKGYTSKRLRKASRGYMVFAGKTSAQLGNVLENHADMQAAVLQNSERDTKPDSRMTNPAKAHTNEKWELLTQFRTTLKKAADSVSSHLVKDITPGIAQFGVHGTTMISAGLALPAMIADCATHICKLGMAKVNGWKMLRLSDGYMIAAKFFANKAETIYLIDAPKYVANTQIHHVASELDQVRSEEHTSELQSH